MDVKFKCSNCGHIFDTDENYLSQDNICAICGYNVSKVANLEDIVAYDVEKKIRNNITKWFKTFGIERTIEIVKNNACGKIKEIYNKELRQRGFKC